MTDATLDAPVKAPTFHPISASRKIKNRVAESAVRGGVPDRDGAVGLGALHRHCTGVPGDDLVDVVEQVARRGAARGVRRRRLPRDLRHDHPGRDRSGAGGAARRHGGRLSGRVRPRVVCEDDDLHGRHPRRRAVDRGRAVHLRAVDRHHGLPAERLRGVAGTGVADASRRGAQHRRDAQARPRRAARSVATRWAFPNGRPSRGSSCRPHCPESSAASCWRWPG